MLSYPKSSEDFATTSLSAPINLKRIAVQTLVIESVERSHLIEVVSPSPGPAEVLLRVDYVGLCGSDLNTFLGTNPLAQLPRVPGHEIAATVVALGERVDRDDLVGAPVVVMPYTNCGSCSACRKGRVNACRYNKTLGVQQDGGMSEWLVVAADKLIINRTLPARRLVLVEPLSVGFHAVARGNVSADDNVVVLGCGMIGIGAVMGAAARGAKVIAVDLGAAKREVALNMGAFHFIASDEESVSAAIDKLTDGDGADVVIEAVGVPETFTAAIDLASYAGRVVYVGYAKSPVTYDTAKFNLKELDIKGSRNATRNDFETVIAHLETLGDATDQLLSRTFDLAEAANALPFWLAERSRTFKVLVKCA